MPSCFLFALFLLSSVGRSVRETAHLLKGAGRLKRTERRQRSALQKGMQLAAAPREDLPGLQGLLQGHLVGMAIEMREEPSPVVGEGGVSASLGEREQGRWSLLGESSHLYYSCLLQTPVTGRSCFLPFH